MFAKSNTADTRGRSLRILVTVSLFLSFTTAFAELSDVAKHLQTIVIENEAATRPLEEERLKVSDEQTLLEARLRDIENAKKEVQKPVELKVDTTTLNTVLLKNHIGRCRIRAGTLEREYIISNSDHSIRFVFAPFDHPLTPLAHLVKTDEGFHVMEIVQNKFKLENVDHPGDMSATLRFDPETLKVIHATFRGQKLQDQLMGFKSSYSPYQLTCIL